MSKYLLLIAFILTSIKLKSQTDNFGYGFRAGMSIAKIDGPSEIGPNGKELEKNKMASGFHIGMSFNVKFTDIMGLRTELTYSQRGNDYIYDGPSYFILPSPIQPVTIMGTRRQKLRLTNSYVDIPLLMYYKFGHFEISGGLNTGLLVSSSAAGNIEFNGVSSLGTPLTPFQVNIDHNYKKDDAGSASSVTKDVVVDGKMYFVPEFLGAYYDSPVKDKNQYKTLDFGLAAGIAYFLNDGLYLGVRYIHGLGDMDRNLYDRSLQSLNNGAFIPREDVNKSQSWQFSVGFSF